MLDVRGSFGNSMAEASAEWRAMSQEQKARYKGVGEASLAEKRKLLLDPEDAFERKRKRAWKQLKVMVLVSINSASNIKATQLQSIYGIITLIMYVDELRAEEPPQCF